MIKRKSQLDQQHIIKIENYNFENKYFQVPRKAVE